MYLLSIKSYYLLEKNYGRLTNWLFDNGRISGVKFFNKIMYNETVAYRFFGQKYNLTTFILIFYKIFRFKPCEQI